MLKAQIRAEDIRDLKHLMDAGLYAGRLLNADTLKGEFEEGGTRRKSFCEAMDIGESTLSTWLQTRRVPRMAALAYVLWLVVQKQSDDLHQREQQATEPYVIRDRDRYAVVQPGTGVGDEVVDRVLASGIETFALAKEIATVRSSRFRDVLDRAAYALWRYEEQYDD